MALINEAEFNVVSSIIYSLSSGKQDLIYFARDSNSSDTLSEVLVLPESKAKPASKTKPALTKKIACITADDALENLRKRWKRKKVRKRRKQLESREERRRRKWNCRKKKSAITEKKREGKCRIAWKDETAEDLSGGMQTQYMIHLKNRYWCCTSKVWFDADNGLRVQCNIWHDLR